MPVGLLGRSLGGPGEPSRDLLTRLGVRWAPLGPDLGAVRHPWVSLGHSWAVFRLLYLPLGRPLGTLWAPLGCFSAPLGLQGALLGRLGFPPGMPLTALRLPDAPEGGTQRSNLGHGSGERVAPCHLLGTPFPNKNVYSSPRFKYRLPLEPV